MITLAESLVIPPVRNSLDDINSQTAQQRGIPLVSDKNWYYYWSRLGDGVNAANRRVNYGTHADRPPADIMPPGAFYTETDRNVIYQNRNGVWHYLAGIMWGTLSPDQRPTDLGVNDAGFDFRATDQVREFIWSGTVWFEVTPAPHGTHAARPAAASEADGNLYVESDRGGVIYQNWTGTGWHYLAGTMWGTISPDQRPTDLGVNDAGFDFRGTDQQREFIWSGTVWIEVAQWTTVAGGISYTRGNVTVQATPVTNGQIVWGDGAGHQGALYADAATVGIGTVSAQNLSFWTAGGAAQMVLTTAGNVGIGTAVPNWPLSFGSSVVATKLAIYDGGAGGGSFGGFGVEPGYLQFHAWSNAGHRFYVNWTTLALTVDLSGNVGIGIAPVYRLQLGIDSAAKPTTSTWTVPSDARLKQNVEPVTDDSLAILDALEWVRFEYSGLGSMPKDQKAIGLSAQDAKKHLPEAVRTVKGKLTDDDAEETELLSIDYHHIIVHAARAIQQLSAEIKRLKQKP